MATCLSHITANSLNMHTLLKAEVQIKGIVSQKDKSEINSFKVILVKLKVENFELILIYIFFFSNINMY